jgi:Ca-activated chloride channel family protein
LFFKSSCESDPLHFTPRAPRRSSLLLAICRRQNFVALLCIAAAASAFGFAFGGVASGRRGEQEPIRATTEMVRIVVSVMDPNGKFVSGLEQKNFRVLDQGAEVPVQFFAPDNSAANVVVMIETSPAVYLLKDQHLAASSALLEGLGPDDRVGLVAYNEAPRGLLDLTTNKSALVAALGQVQYTLGEGQLNFFDSIGQVVDQISSLPDKKALVLLSTGLDSSPRSRWYALVAKLRGQDDVLFPVALGGTLRTAKPDPKKKKNDDLPQVKSPLTFAQSTRDLKALAAMTGGRAFFPESDADFVPAYQQIAAALRHQYVLGIAPQHDGAFHKLEVELVDSDTSPATADVKKPGQTIFAREGYLAPPQQ